MSLAMGLFMGAGLVDQHQNLNWVGILYMLNRMQIFLGVVLQFVTIKLSG